MSDRHAARRPFEQLALPDIDASPELALSALPAPTPADPCARCGWYVRQHEETCPLCHAPKDISP